MTEKDQSAVTGPKGTPAWPAETTTEPATHKPAMHLSGDLEQRIRQRAYELWESEGRPQGREQAHWQQAEREIAGRSASGRA
jgi:hypothetical protein